MTGQFTVNDVQYGASGKVLLFDARSSSTPAQRPRPSRDESSIMSDAGKRKVLANDPVPAAIR